MTEQARRRDPPPDPEDRDLILRAQSGDRNAFGILVRRHQRRVHGLGFRILRNAADADDLVQETFLRAWRALDRFEAGRPIAPWLLRIASNHAMTMLDSRRRRPAEELTEQVPSPGPTADETVDRERLHERIRKEVERLPEDQRVILALRAGEEYSYREIADLLDVPIGTVMSRLSRARETLRKRVRR